MEKLEVKNIMVIGDIMLDKYVNCDVNRISPEAPIPILKYVNTKNVLGGAANVANNLVSNNQKVQLMGTVGEDENGAILLKLLKTSGIDQSYIMHIDEKCTTAKSRFVSMGHQIFRFDEEVDDEIAEEIQIKCLSQIEEHISEFDIVIISDYLKGFLTVDFTQRIINIANKHNIPVIVDPKDKDCSKYKNCTLIKPNKKEMEAFLGGKHIEEGNVVAEAMALKEKLNCKYVLLTLGAKGMVFVDENCAYYCIESEAKEVYDVTGAGDTVLSFIAMGFEGQRLEISKVKLANKAAAVKVGKFGTSVVKYDEIFCEENGKNLDRKQIALLSDKIKSQGKKIVFTNGCFDILHSGHVCYLKEAKKLGDILIVGLNSDNSIKRLKGENRPILTEDERCEILMGLESVDYVVLFDEDTPLNLINVVKPNVLVKGGDYKIEAIVGYSEVIEAGGQVVTLSFVEGKSTTNIVEKIQKLK